MVVYFGIPHGIVNQGGMIYFELDDLGANWISKNQELSKMIVGVSFKDVIFSYAPELIQKGEKYWHVLLLITSEEDLRNLRYKNIMEHIEDLVKKLRGDPYFEDDAADKTTRILMLERQSKERRDQL